MRVAFLSDVYFPRINGVSTSIQTFRRELALLGLETLLVAPAYDGQTQADDDTVIRLPSRSVPRDPEDRLMSLKAALALEDRLRAAEVDLIHVQTPFTAHYAGQRLARRLGVPLVATYHTLFEEYLHHYLPALPAGWLRGAARLFSRTQCNACDRVIVPSRAMVERLSAYGVKAPLEQLPTGIPNRQFGAGQGARFRARHGIPEDRPVALFVGRVAFEKNIGFLLEAVQVACRQCPDVLLLVAGEGPARPALERQAARLGLARQVRFLDYLDRQQALPDCYAGADLFVFASRTETQGLVLIEALAAGLPVLALSAMGTADILAPGEGCESGPDDPAAFGRRMAALLADRPALARMSQAARRHAEQWSDQAMALRLARLYRALIAPLQSA